MVQEAGSRLDSLQNEPAGLDSDRRPRCFPAPAARKGTARPVSRAGAVHLRALVCCCGGCYSSLQRCLRYRKGFSVDQGRSLTSMLTMMTELRRLVRSRTLASLSLLLRGWERKRCGSGRRSRRGGAMPRCPRLMRPVARKWYHWTRCSSRDDGHRGPLCRTGLSGRGSGCIGRSDGEKGSDILWEAHGQHASVSRLSQIARHCFCSNFFACFSNGWGSPTLEIVACSVTAIYRR